MARRQCQAQFLGKQIFRFQPPVPDRSTRHGKIDFTRIGKLVAALPRDEG
jgi:hypothetical protein